MVYSTVGESLGSQRENGEFYFSKLRGWLWGLPMPTDSYRWVATVVAGGATLNTARHQALEDRNQTETRLVLAT